MMMSCLLFLENKYFVMLHTLNCALRWFQQPKSPQQPPKICTGFQKHGLLVLKNVSLVMYLTVHTDDILFIIVQHVCKLKRGIWFCLFSVTIFCLSCKNKNKGKIDSFCSFVNNTYTPYSQIALMLIAETIGKLKTNTNSSSIRI